MNFSLRCVSGVHAAAGDAYFAAVEPGRRTTAGGPITATSFTFGAIFFALMTAR